SIAAVPDHTRAGWAAAAVDAVREPYRSLAAELLTGDFPARDDLHAITSAKDLTRRIRMRAIQQEKRELLAAIQRLAPDSEEGRSVRLRLRELDAARERLTAEQ
ncbi:MAG: primase, partial [Microbacterium sp.]|nr:primase [Microbacterium sp.]